MALCVEAWTALNREVCHTSPRYVAIAAPLARDDENYINDAPASFHAALRDVGDVGGFRAAPKATRPQAYWLIKQKSVVECSDNPTMKFSMPCK